jgi:hypothetical protein
MERLPSTTALRTIQHTLWLTGWGASGTRTAECKQARRNWRGPSSSFTETAGVREPTASKAVQKRDLVDYIIYMYLSSSNCKLSHSIRLYNASNLADQSAVAR